MEDVFSVDLDCRILICKRCRYAVVPAQVARHLADQHRRLLPADRHLIAAEVEAYPGLAHDQSAVVYPDPGRPPVKGLPVFYDGVRCSSRLDSGLQCRYVCRTVRGMKAHCAIAHKWTNQAKWGGDRRSRQRQCQDQPWQTGRACQRLFECAQWKHYFEVSDSVDQPLDSASARLLDDNAYGFFRLQDEDIAHAADNATEEANQVKGFEGHRSMVVPWLRETGIAAHIQGLKKDEIRASIALPKDGEGPALHAINAAAEEILREAHSWCLDGPDCLLSWPCRVVLGRFQSSDIDQVGRTRAFDPYKEPSTLKTYFRHLKSFLAYLYRITTTEGYHFSAESSDVGRRPETIIQLTPEQKELLLLVRTLADKTAADPEDDSFAQDLKTYLRELLLLILCHQTGARRYSSPLLSFCAMLSIRASTLGWMEPGNYNSHLSAVIWVAQLLIFYHSACQERTGCGETLRLVKRQCKATLQQTCDTPMGEILRWRLLLFKISKEAVADHQATWDTAEQALTYEGTELRMEDIPTLLLSEYSECRRLLYTDLMLGATDFRYMCPAELSDNLDVEIVNWDFTQHKDNDVLLAGHKFFLLRAIERSREYREQFLSTNSEAERGFTWRESALASYERAAQNFLKRLLVLVHISGGQPLREGELLSVTWRNTQRRRAICIRHGQVMIHTKYHKGQQQSSRYKDNVRFLSPTIGSLLLDYIVYVTPLRQLFWRQSSQKSLLSAFLWEKDGKVWPDSCLTRCLEDASARAEIPRLHISNWRQMTVAIVKTKFAAQIGCFEQDADDEDAEEIEEDIRIMTKQRNHKTQTVNRAYANQTASSFGNVWDGLIRMGLRASTLWQDFWGVETVLRDRKRAACSDNDERRLVKRVANGVYRPRKPWTSGALLGAIKKLYKKADMDWRSPEQERALTTIMSWTEQVVAILPTGAGKSLLFMLPCTLPGAGITIVVVPLVALRGDLIRRLKELEINHLVWSPGERRESSLILVSVEAAIKKDFLTYAQSLVTQQKLDRVVVDECHLTVTAASYRERVKELGQIRMLRTQFVYLTATLPPSMWTEFQERNFLINPKLIRASSNRRNIMYVVKKVEAGQGSLLVQAAAEAQDMSTIEGLFDRTRDKAILYVRTRDEAAELSELLGCYSYTAKSGSAEEKAEMLAQWTADPGQIFLVATTALAEGFDYAHIRVVINVNEPESLLSFAQESGRAGRDGARAYSLTILPSGWLSQADRESASEYSPVSSALDPGLGKLREKLAVHRYLEGKQCFRTSLSERLDSNNERRWCMLDDIACDFCQVSHAEPISPPIVKNVEQDYFTGPSVIQRQRLSEYSELARYQEDLAAVRGSCLLCRAIGQPWNHQFSTCFRRFDVFDQKKQTLQRCKEKGQAWLKPYSACYYCLNPQSICLRADPEAGGQGPCEDRDVVLPLCYGLFYSVQGSKWLADNFQRQFDGFGDFLGWLGEESTFGGGKAIQATRVAARLLAQYNLY